ncbi:MAG TPA: ESX secretion-associated protein EspG [Pseudonocardiaceae bacterium]
MGPRSTIVLSTTEFDVLWECEDLPTRHVALDVPSPGLTRAARADVVDRALAGLADRGLAKAGQAEPELADRLALLAAPQRSVDVWLWSDHEIRALAATRDSRAIVAVVDRDEVWLIPARESSFVHAAVSVAGDCPAGNGHGVTVPLDALRAADAEVNGDPRALITALERRGVPLSQAQELSRMFTGITLRGQFGAERTPPRVRRRRSDRVVAFYDNPQGRYLFLTKPGWATITPTDNARLTTAISELFDEL